MVAPDTPVIPAETPGVEETIVIEFEEAWNSPSRPGIEAYLNKLPSDHPRRAWLTNELAHIDLENRLKAGDQAPLVGMYLRAFPNELGTPVTAVELIEAEYQRRWHRGPGVLQTEYMAHFRQYEELLRTKLRPLWTCPKCRCKERIDETIESVICPKCHGLFPARSNAGSRSLHAGEEQSQNNLNTEWPRAPGYTILGELGRGSMGVVYKARQHGSGMQVAIKTILSGMHATPESLARFRREASIVGELKHPNIVRLLTMGHLAGRPFVVFEYVDGGSLADKINGTPQLSRETARLVETLARAMFYAHTHEKKLVHRDLKPGNILLEKDNTAKIADFGLARWLEAESELSRTNDSIGTPSYMAPEQADPKGELVGPATDVYGLGAILYEMLTGRPPFKARTTLETLVQVKSHDPVPPRDLQPETPRDLETICLKCLQKEPAKRYANAQTLADDLDRWLHGRSIVARPVSSVEQAWRWCKRNRELAISSGLGLVVSFALLGITIAFLLTKSRDNDLLIKGASDLRKQLHRAERALAINYADQAQTMCENGEVPSGLLLMGKGLHQAIKADALDIERYFRMNLALWASETSQLRTIISDPAGMDKVAVLPDGRTIVSINNGNAVRIWDTRDGVMRGELVHDALVTDVAICADGTTIMTASGERPAGKNSRPWTVIRRWEAGSGRPIGRPVRVDDKLVKRLAIHRDDKTVLISCDDKSVQLWNLETGKPLALEIVTPDEAQTVAFSSQGHFALSASSAGVVLWDIRSTSASHLKLVGSAPVYDVLFSPDEKYVLTASNDGAVLWSTNGGQRVGTVMSHLDGNFVYFVAFSPDGQTIATGGSDSSVQLWRTSDQKKLPTRFKLQEAPGRMAFSRNGKHLVTITLDGVAQLWDVTNGIALTPPLLHSDDFREAEFIENDNAFIIYSSSGNIYIRQVPRRQLERSTIPLGSKMYPSLKGEIVTRDRSSAIVIGEDLNIARLYDIKSGQFRGTPLVHPITNPKNKPTISDACFSSDGKYVWTGSSDETVRIWSSISGAADGKPLQQGEPVKRIFFSPDGSVVAVITNSTVRLLTATSRELRAVLNHTKETNHVAFSRDSRFILTCSKDNTARLWDSATGQSLCDPLLHPDSVHFGCFDPNGRYVITGCCDISQRNGGEMRLWEVPTGSPVGQPFRQEVTLDALAWSPDGTLVVAGGGDKMVHVWDPILGQRIGHTLKHRYFAIDATFSPDTTVLVTASLGGFDGLGEIRFWDARLTKPIGAPVYMKDAVFRVSFQGDNNKLTYSASESIGIWNLPYPIEGEIEHIIASVEAFTGLEMTEAEAPRVMRAAEWHVRKRNLDEMGGSLLVDRTHLGN